MLAKPGDRLTVTAHRVGERVRHAEIRKLRGTKGARPTTDLHESLVYPGLDIVVEHTPRKHSTKSEHPAGDARADLVQTPC